MSATQIIALVRDAVIVGALAFVIWWIHESGETSVKLKDMKAVAAQIDANGKTIAEWKAQSQAAEVQREKDMQTINTAIAAERAPVYVVRGPTNPSPVSGAAGKAPGQCPPSGSADTRPQRDIRPELDAFALKYETALTECRTALAQWPTERSR